jgi:integrase-like protein
MTPLRQRTQEDMEIRNLALNTQDSYLQQVSLFARHFAKSPEFLGHEEIRAYQIYLMQEKKLAPGSVTIAVSALRLPGASPLLFGKYLMDHCAFISLEDISRDLPSYREEVVPVTMDKVLKTAYEQLEQVITACLKQHRGNHSVVSTMLNTLLAIPDHPYGFGTLYDSEFNLETRCRERIVIAETADLDKDQLYAKERALISEIKAQLERGRKCHVYSVFTTKHDVIARLENLLRAEGIPTGVLRASVPCPFGKQA